MGRRTVIPYYSRHHTQAWRYRGLWTDGQSYLTIADTTLRPGDTEGYGQTNQSYLAIAHTTLRPGDTEGYGQTDSHTLV